MVPAAIPMTSVAGCQGPRRGDRVVHRCGAVTAMEASPQDVGEHLVSRV